MNARKHIQDELEALNSSLPAPNKPVFSPPEGYFENFAHSVLMKIKSGKQVTDELNELSPLLAGASKKMPYSVPDDFFSGISSQLDTITREEVQPSFFKEVGNKIPYQVPD